MEFKVKILEGKIEVYQEEKKGKNTKIDNWYIPRPLTTADIQYVKNLLGIWARKAINQK